MYKKIMLRAGSTTYRPNNLSWDHSKHTVYIAIHISKVNGNSESRGYDKRLVKVVVDSAHKAYHLENRWKKMIAATDFKHCVDEDRTWNTTWNIRNSSEREGVYQDLKSYFQGNKGWSKFFSEVDLGKEVSQYHKQDLYKEYSNNRVWRIDYSDGTTESNLLGCDAILLLKDDPTAKLYVEYTGTP